MGRVEGKVAFITGAGRGQGRSHAVRLAEEGADIIAVDICHDVDSLPYHLSSPDDLKETARQIEALDRRVVAVQADVRERAQMVEAVELVSTIAPPSPCSIIDGVAARTVL